LLQAAVAQALTLVVVAAVAVIKQLRLLEFLVPSQ
jgi:hypothetical protein